MRNTCVKCRRDFIFSAQNKRCPHCGMDYSSGEWIFQVDGTIENVSDINPDRAKREGRRNSYQATDKVMSVPSEPKKRTLQKSSTQTKKQTVNHAGERGEQRTHYESPARRPQSNASDIGCVSSCIAAVALMLLAIWLLITLVLPEYNYKKAEELYAEGDYEEAYRYYNKVYGKWKYVELGVDERIKEVEYMLQADALKTAEVGDVVALGGYYADQDERCQLEWKVISKKGSKLLLLCDRCVYSMPYNYDIEEHTSWETSDVRWWLNYAFLSAAFCDKFHEAICDTTLGNKVLDLNTGNMVLAGDTVDKVFLLSAGEMEYYVKSNEERMRSASDFAKEIGAVDIDGYVQYWLRTPGAFNAMAAYVARDGVVNAIGNQCQLTDKGICPSLWIDVSLLETQ